MNYRRLNLILLIALLALVPARLLVPWLRAHTGMLYPGCALEPLTGHRCPMCGLTTGLRHLITGRTQESPGNPLTIPVAAVVMLEIVAPALLSYCTLSRHAVDISTRWDILQHAVLLIAYLAYCAAFFACGA